MKGNDWLACFGAEVARPPHGLEMIEEHHARHPSAEEVQKHEAMCEEILQAVYSMSKNETAKRMKMPGKGCGFTWHHTPWSTCASKDGIHVLMSGEVAHWPGVDAVQASHNAFLRNEQPAEEDDAHWLLDFYRTFTDPDLDQEEGLRGASCMGKALECLAALRGSFAFCIYDSIRHRVLAARDREGACPMFWGCTETGQLLFGSNLSDLSGTNPTATSFPAGCLYTSESHMIAYSPGERGWFIAGDDMPGELVSFVEAEDLEHFKGVKAIPRITSKGLLCGTVYKVASTADMSRPSHLAH